MSAFLKTEIHLAALALHSVKDANGSYIWKHSDDTIFGRPVISTPYMPNIGTGAKPIAFGDLSYYWIMERRPLSVKVLRERYAIEGLVGFAAHEHLDRKLIRPEAVKTLTIA
ncbi:MAG: phage major capsid protein [Lachnospiraceae bacterium]|uniref:Phage major capsid protein n=1 Tax=Dorea phocaeensis TaxID=2040291 RepID=A0A850HMF7_9FIRM|nr:phage major capsid protein [Lachnospiraceae bacterium]NSK15139.1 phage major capsid protein [Dorea phocaeensis]NVH58912.1 phage major capsid protein [Dorea phocaeensis]